MSHSYTVKKVCEEAEGLPKGCPNRYRCVELIHVGYPCPHGLDKIPIAEARKIQRKGLKMKKKDKIFVEVTTKELYCIEPDHYPKHWDVAKIMSQWFSDKHINTAYHAGRDGAKVGDSRRLLDWKVLKDIKDYTDKHPRLTEDQLREFLFGWLWVEDNMMKHVRSKVKEGRKSASKMKKSNKTEGHDSDGHSNPLSCPKCGRENTGGMHCSTLGQHHLLVDEAKILKQGITIDELLSWGKQHSFEIDDRAMFGFTMTRNDIKVRVWLKKI